VRDLGKRGSRVTTASSQLAAASFSRYSARSVRCPPEHETAKFLEWLLDFGRREPGHFLYPTSDALAYLFARHENELRPFFLLYQPKVPALITLLDKRRLQEACSRAGVATAPTWFPQDESQVEALARELPFPVFLKARTQVMLLSLSKGSLAFDREQLLAGFREAAAKGRYLPEVERDFGDVSRPMLQRYYEHAIANTYSISGFIDERGEILGTRASVKILQRPRRIGVGVCFEAAEVLPEPLQAVMRIARATGYFGVFETEFILDGQKPLLIDFNPRFYGQMGFECARGLRLPSLALAGALGDRARLSSWAAAANLPQPVRAYRNRFFMKLSLGMRKLLGNLDSNESQYWRAWEEAHGEGAVDASVDSDDWAPGVVQALIELEQAARHPRAFLRSVRT
jgi:D-aspartate ligase